MFPQEFWIVGYVFDGFWGDIGKDDVWCCGGFALFELHGSPNFIECGLVGPESVIGKVIEENPFFKAGFWLLVWWHGRDAWIFVMVKMSDVALLV